MPYVPSFRRARMRRGSDPANVGELCYQLTADCVNYLNGAVSFHHIAEVVAALEYAKLEFVRRVGNPYEDAKREEHGDVF